MPTLDNEHT